MMGYLTLRLFTVVKAGYGRRRMKVGSMRWRRFRSGVCGVSSKDRCRNSDARERCGLKQGCGWESLMKSVTLGNVDESPNERGPPNALRLSPLNYDREKDGTTGFGSAPPQPRTGRREGGTPGELARDVTFFYRQTSRSRR
ncbi:hypothetical protein EVAR_77339_1 [Eumeta japonica]|uniref:Uncharacterized protein n=1 Tax=Eumeta variegata TaxID=151549 RepID=A0A4C1UZ12_EUMVA|nr:hypothetical protein EVAR_77339_1 [Eumeta japonica]